MEARKGGGGGVGKQEERSSTLPRDRVRQSLRGGEMEGPGKKEPVVVLWARF